MRVCRECGKEKDISEFSKDKSKNDGLQARCKQCQNTRSADHYQNNKEKYRDNCRRNKKAKKDFLYSVKERCSQCGNSNQTLLDIKHTDNNGESVSKLVQNGYSLERIQKEFEKCIVVCANCRYKQTKQKPQYANVIYQKTDYEIKKGWIYNFLLQSQCFDCGEKDERCLEFHHLRDKIADVSCMAFIRKFSIRDIENEVSKCIVLCANCHRIRHPENWRKQS